MERILLLSMGFGTGHNEAAKSLEREFLKRSGVRAEMVDLLSLIPKTFHPILQNGYLGMLNRFPLFYHYLYGWTHQSRLIRSMSSGFIGKMGWTIRKKLKQILQDLQPTRIVTTHPFTLLMLPSGWEDIPSVGVVTDYELHPIWLARVPDVLCIPPQLLSPLQLEMMEWKTGAKIVETGLPIDRSFYHPVSSVEARRGLGLQLERPIVLIMGGGTGLGPLEELVKEILPLPQIHFVVMTGSNEELYQTLSSNYKESHIQIESFRKDIPLWMSAADLLVTKPGGVTVTEAIAKHLPMFLFESCPGQEKANQQHLLDHGVASITELDTISEQMKKYFFTQTELNRQQHNFDSLVTPHAIDQIMYETLRSERSKLNVLSF